jgi:hypothetical protein
MNPQGNSLSGIIVVSEAIKRHAMIWNTSTVICTGETVEGTTRGASRPLVSCSTLAFL